MHDGCTDLNHLIEWIPSTTTIRKTICNLFAKRESYKGAEPETSESANTSQSSRSSPEPCESALTMKKEIRLHIMKALTVSPSPPGSSSEPTKTGLLAIIRKEMSLWECGGDLQMIYKSLLTIPPTSVEAERAFSAAGLFCTKLRSRLNDESLDITLCFLRTHFQLYCESKDQLSRYPYKRYNKQSTTAPVYRYLQYSTVQVFFVDIIYTCKKNYCIHINIHVQNEK